MKIKLFIILLLTFMSNSVATIINAQNDTISQSNTKTIIDTVKTNAVTQAVIETKTINTIEKEPYSFIVEKSIVNNSFWTQPYRYEDKTLKTLAVKIIIKRTSAKTTSLDFNQFTLIDDTKKLRIRPSGVYYLKGNKKKYLRSKSVNKNYNEFKETAIKGFQNFEAETYKSNFLGLKRKKEKSSVKTLKKLVIKSKKTTYYLDFPVSEGFTYGKINFKDKPIGFAAIKY